MQFHPKKNLLKTLNYFLKKYLLITLPQKLTPFGITQKKVQWHFWWKKKHGYTYHIHTKVYHGACLILTVIPNLNIFHHGDKKKTNAC